MVATAGPLSSKMFVALMELGLAGPEGGQP